MQHLTLYLHWDIARRSALASLAGDVLNRPLGGDCKQTHAAHRGLNSGCDGKQKVCAVTARTPGTQTAMFVCVFFSRFPFLGMCLQE